MAIQQVPTRAVPIVRTVPEVAMPAMAPPTVKEIPYDYVATFKLTGTRGNRVQDVINITIEGAFVAVAIGYSFFPAPEQIIGSPIDFLYSIIDSGTGRELQNKPIHNIAGLGEPTGQRPFRPLAKPMLFLPRSTIRIEVEEVVTYKDATLQIVLHGYKILGYGTAP